MQGFPWGMTACSALLILPMPSFLLSLLQHWQTKPWRSLRILGLPMEH